jgi:hypothetical protein
MASLLAGRGRSRFDFGIFGMARGPRFEEPGANVRAAGTNERAFTLAEGVAHFQHKSLWIYF